MPTVRLATAGVVLTGGESRRMGTNKATLVVDGRPLAARVADVLTAADCAPIWFQGGEPDDLAVLTSVGPIVADVTPGRGPVGAIASALLAAANGPFDLDGVLIAACDLIDLDADTVRSVVGAGGHGVVAVATTGTPSDSTRADSDHRWHLLSWWSLALMRPVNNAIAEGVTSYRDLLHRLSGAPLPGGEHLSTVNIAVNIAVKSVAVDAAAMSNANHPTDVDGR